MAPASYESRLQPLFDRLEDSKRMVDAQYERKVDGELVQSLSDGSYGDRELDLLFGYVEKPLLLAVTVLAAGYRKNRPYGPWEFIKDDPFARTVALLAENKRRSTDDGELPIIDLVDTGSDLEALGRKGAAQVALVRRLVSSYGYEGLQARIARVLNNPDEPLHAPQADTAEECARLLRLMAPIERIHDFPMLYFQSPTGQLVHSAFLTGNTQCVPEYYMGVDK